MIPDVLFQVALTGSTGAFVAGAKPTERWIVHLLHFANTDSSARTVRLHLVKPGDSEGVHNRLFPDLSIPATDIDEYAGRLIVPPAWKLTGYASAAGVVSVCGFGIRYPSP